MKKIAGLVIAGVASACFADMMGEGKLALEKKNYSEAANAFRISCESGNGKGCYELGMMYENGIGMAQNKYKASNLYAQACRAQEALGCSNMALSFDTP
ncbi:hypothetical protein [Sulfuricurvum sp.]|uniref:hypothetical protein n=1 Tax=Sulfuricurvum sp. TaxID=2025608 RepID=UPI003C4D83AF